jgi:hypothetical protein
MSTPEEPAGGASTSTTSSAGGGGYGFQPVAGARMPIPGNAEFAVFFLIWVVLVIIWAASDAVNAALFATLTTVLTFGYLLSRGIAKASRVLEQ